jgi:hypothetical protein
VAGRRSLVDGLKKVDRRKELAFVRGEAVDATPEKPKTPKAKPERKEKQERRTSAKPKPEPQEEREGEHSNPISAAIATPPYAGRSPLTTRIRSDLATALKRASLERQLAGEKPNTLQEILEEALEPWLKEKGYLKD